MILRQRGGFLTPVFIFSCFYPLVGRRLSIGGDDPLTSDLFGGDTPIQNELSDVPRIFAVELSPLADGEQLRHDDPSKADAGSCR